MLISYCLKNSAIIVSKNNYGSVFIGLLTIFRANFFTLQNRIWKFFVIAKEPTVIIYTIYLAFSILGLFVDPVFFAIHLIELVRLSNDLRNVVYSVTLNGRKLFITVCTIYIYM